MSETTMQARCGWCRAILRVGTLPETTGICPTCADNWKAQIRSRADDMTCNGPTGPCVLEIGHFGDHQRAKKYDAGDFYDTPGRVEMGD